MDAPRSGYAMKLQNFSDAELDALIQQLERTLRHGIDKHKRWEAEQKLKLAKAEQRKRNPVERVKRGIKTFFGK